MNAFFHLFYKKCVTARHACEDDDECCKGLKCVQVAPVNNNGFFDNYFPIGNIFNPSRQCTRVAKKKKPTPNGPGGMGAGGSFDWSIFVPFGGAGAGAGGAGAAHKMEKTKEWEYLLMIQAYPVFVVKKSV